LVTQLAIVVKYIISDSVEVGEAATKGRSGEVPHVDVQIRVNIQRSLGYVENSRPWRKEVHGRFLTRHCRFPPIGGSRRVEDRDVP
jgi:hypothetical protein